MTILSPLSGELIIGKLIFIDLNDEWRMTMCHVVLFELTPTQENQNLHHGTCLVTFTIKKKPMIQFDTVCIQWKPIHCVKWCYCHTLWSTCNTRNFLFVDEFDTIILFCWTLSYKYDEFDTIILFCWTLSYNFFSVGFSTRGRFFQYGVTHPPHRGLVSGLWFVFIKSEK